MPPHGNFLKTRDCETLDYSEDVWVLLLHKDPKTGTGRTQNNAYETETSCDLAGTHLSPGLS